MGYRELFDSIRCQLIVIIEDDFRQEEYRKERALYDITRMSLEDRKLYLKEIEDISIELGQSLSKYLEAFDECFDAMGRWEECIPRWDITDAFPLVGEITPELQKEIEYEYNIIDDNLMKAVYEVGAKYGIGVSHPSQFDQLFDDYILYDNRAKPIRVYFDFSATTQQLFMTDINQATCEKSIVCIVDNYLDGSNRAQEIMNIISQKCVPERKNIVGSIFSSKDRFEEIDEKLYFEYTSKETPCRLEACIARSAYNYFIAELKKETVCELEKAFDAATRNKGIAYFLSQRAKVEGTSEYQIINDWIKLLSTSTQKDSETMRRLIGLSRIINDLDDDEFPDADLQRLNTLEAFDYSINDYFLPVVPGDVFTNDCGDWFVLIGQDCDMARSSKRSPRNALAELLPAKIREQTDFKKWTNDLATASIYSFREDLTEHSKILQVDYQKRQFIANEIINLCSFNVDGQCRISLDSPIESIQRQLMPEYMITYYEQLQKYFCSIKRLLTQEKDAFMTIASNEYTPRLISACELDLKSDMTSFNLRRVCRLTHSYVFYLYKLYLEYRGRQPFQSINLIRQEDTTLPVTYNNTETELFLSFRCIPVPEKNNRKEWCWIIEVGEINRILEELKIAERLNERDKELMITTGDGEWNLSNNKKLFIKKQKQKVQLIVK